MWMKMCDLNNDVDFQLYPDGIQKQISLEFSRLKGHCYLDHAGSTLYSDKQLQNVFADFSDNIFANPHAKSSVAKSTEDAVDIVRYQILEHFNTDTSKYSVIFTSGATAALKTIAECFDFGTDNSHGILAYLEDNHTSVLGMRSYSKEFVKISLEDAFKNLSPKPMDSNNYIKRQDEQTDFEYKTNKLDRYNTEQEITGINTKINYNTRFNDIAPESKTNSLFVYPAQSNFSGTKYPLSWIDSIHNGKLNSIINLNRDNWYTALDCASHVSSSPLDLSKYQPDFVTISFYKIFGYPTGLGALLVKKSSEHLLIKKYLGGGTVLLALSDENLMIPRTILHQRFEDGTLPYLSIIAIRHGFDTIRRLNLTFDLISLHTYALARYVYGHLVRLHHANGKPAVVLYHDTTFESSEHQGGIVNFNLLRADGEYVGYSEVLQICNLHGISIRTGCFCNPGSCQRYLKLSSAQVRKHFEAGHVCGDQHDLVNGCPTGSVRVSFGYMSSKADADKLLAVIENCFLTKTIIRKLPNNWKQMRDNYKNLFFGEKDDSIHLDSNRASPIPNNNALTDQTKARINKEDNVISNNNEEFKYLRAAGRLEHIFLYPVKSCGAFAATDDWELTGTGLKYDRQWMIVNSTGVGVTQKQNRNLCLVRPLVDLKRDVLILKYKDNPYITLPLNGSNGVRDEAYFCQSKVCDDKILGWDCGDKVSEWLSENLEMPGLRLLRQCEEYGRSSKKKSQEQLSLANKAQYLLINSSSVTWLQDKISSDWHESFFSTVQRFRPNFVVRFENAFIENELEQCQIDDLVFKVGGKCTRCQMICIDQSTGEISKEPLTTLSKELRGKISFGIYLSLSLIESQESSIKIESTVLGY